MSSDSVLTLSFGIVTLGILVWLILRANKQHVELTRGLQKNFQDIQTQFSSTANQLQNLGNAESATRNDLLSELSSIRQILDSMLAQLNAHLDRTHDGITSEIKRSSDETIIKIGSQTQELSAVKDQVENLRKSLDEAITV